MESKLIVKRYIPIVTKKETSKVYTGDILYIEKQLRMVHIYTHGRTYSFYGKVKEIVGYLEENFYMCHNSCIINMDNIARIEDGIFYFEGGKSLRIGQNNYQRTRQHYVKFLMKSIGGC